MLDPRLREFLDPRPFVEASYRRKVVTRAAIVCSRLLPQRMKARAFRGTNFYCPVCDHRISRFLSWGVQQNVWCPVCTAFDRHRFAWLFFERATDLFDDGRRRMLHVAPEPAFERRFRQVDGIDYVSADLVNPQADVQMDVTNIEYPAASFDVIYCSHVLEHVPVPRRALEEFHRVLTPEGWAVIAVPIYRGPTIGDASVSNPRERERLFGQHDHFWRFGADFASMIEDAGFQVRTVRARDIASPDECRSMAVRPNMPIFHCRKRS